MVNAINRFDLSRGLRLTTFAAPNISGEIKRHFRDRAWSIRIPRDLQERYLRITRTSTVLASELGRAPTVMEISRELGVSEEHVLEAMDAGRNYRTASLDATLQDSERRSAADSLGERDARFDAAEQRAVIEQGLDALPERERAIVLMRFARDLSQREIATRVGLSQMHVSRLLRRSIHEMRATLAPSERRH